MKTDTEMKFTVSKEEGIFKRVPVSELSLKDKFLKYRPKTDAEKHFMKAVKNVIKAGVKDFWRPICDPSFDGEEDIRYQPGKRPAVGESYNWWEKKAKDFCPERGSRVGTKSEYVAVLAVIIKELVISGWKVADAWSAVCNDSKELGHYWNSKDAKHGFEETGSREICGWCDLANTKKMFKEDEETGGFWEASGDYCDDSKEWPLAELCHYKYCNFATNCDHRDFDTIVSSSDRRDFDTTFDTGWIVLETD